MMDYNLFYQMSELCKENEIGFGIRKFVEDGKAWMPLPEPYQSND